MSDKPPDPVTVEELLPALIELASIQSDLLSFLERPRAAFGSRGFTGFSGPGTDFFPTDPPGIDTGFLQIRSRVLLRWLLDRVKGHSVE